MPTSLTLSLCNALLQLLSTSSTMPRKPVAKLPRGKIMAEALILALHLLASSAAALTTDGLALLALKSAVSVDPTGALTAWVDTDDSPCSWTGITCRLARVVAVALPDRTLTGYLPSELSLLSALETLALARNRLSGPIPAALAALAGLAELDLSRNNLSGPIPPDLGRMASLAHLDLSSNLFSGPLPKSIAALPNLSGVLNLSYNLLSGPIPPEYGAIPIYVSLDLRRNNLAGEIPQLGPLLSQGPTAFSGNPGLCGLPLKNPCPPSNQDPKLPEPNPTLTLNPSEATFRQAAKEKRRNPAGTITILSAVVLVAAASIFLLQWHFRKRRASGEGSESTNEKGSSPAYGATISGGSIVDERREGHASEVYAVLDEGFGLELEELLRASAYVLGKSRSGIVYKVVVCRGSSAVAVHRLSENDDCDAPSGGGDEWRRRRAFETEVAAIGRAKHPNVVRLLAYYYAPDERLLIYDYISNGSLYAALHGGPSNSTAPTLPWAARLNILQGAARGLAYLHEFSPRKYAHGGFTSSKILLDDDLRPHISGFGLARLVSCGSHQKLVPSSSKKLAPPRVPAGYLPPEARGPAAASTLSQRADVYSFGVVALEVVTGRAADAELEAWVRRAFREERPLSEVVDPVLLHEVHAKREVLAVFHVALGCTEADPDQRQRMRTVAESLDRIGPSG